ncbi:uncharacterized protein LOC136090706 isoform X2 [Hydra vulgaris]|uniref:Uncharacterized protein LOC136090706 isoform X2 n=1 Tax=Hydra vulgaris TaxID=6087 RepID=A0ABM4DGN9_HYDVU
MMILKILKFHSESIIGGVAEKAKTFIKLIPVLENHSIIGENNYDELKKVLKKIGRNDLVEFFPKKSDTKSNEFFERRIPHGCVFRFEVKKYGNICTNVEYQLDHKSDSKLSKIFWLTKEVNDILYVKVHNLMFENEKVKFSFSFQGSPKIDCAVTITGNCKYEYIHEDIFIATPEPIFNNEFADIKKSNSLDWRETQDISLKKVPDDKSIDKCALDYFDRNFSSFKDVIYVRLFSTSKNDSPFVASKFLSLFGASKNSVCAVLSGYPLRYHASCLRCKIETFEVCEDENRITIFYSDYNLVIIARIATSSDCIKSESKNCLNDIILFVNVNKPLIENKGIIIIGIVIVPSFERELIKKELFVQFPNHFDLEKILVLCKDDMDNEKEFQDWWRFITEYCKKKKSINKCEGNKEELFKHLIGLTIMFMAKVDHCLPTLESNSQKQIKSLLLNYEQLKAINDNELKKIINGGYGSGKSVVGKEIVKSCITKKSDITCTLYYICCNHFSLFECEMKEFVDSLKKPSNVNVICNNLHDLWVKMCKSKNVFDEKVSLPILLEYLAGINNNEVCFVLDELSGEHVNDKEVVLLNNLFLSVLKDSLVVFIPESVDKNRELFINGESNSIQVNCFSENILKMKVISLKKLMRVTVQNNNLIDLTQNLICKSKTFINLPRADIKMALEKNENFELPGSENHAFIHNSHTSTVNSKDVSSQLMSNSSISKLNDSETFANNFKMIGNNFYDPDKDHMLKIVVGRSNDLDPNTLIATNYVFKTGSIGHSINGEKPRVIFLPFNDITKIFSVKVLSIVLKKLCFADKLRKTVVICSHLDELLSVGYAIKTIENYEAVFYSPHMQKCMPTFEEKSNVANKLKTCYHVLVTDCKGFSGAESESIIVLVSADEIFLRHVLVDAMSRSNSHLIVLVLGSNDIKTKSVAHKTETIGSVFINWSKNIVEKITVKKGSDECHFYIDDHKEFLNNSLEFEDGFDMFKTENCLKVFPENYLIYDSAAFELTKSGKEEFESEIDIRVVDILIEKVSSEWERFTSSFEVSKDCLFNATIEQIDSDNTHNDESKMKFLLTNLYEHHPTDYKAYIEKSLKKMKRDDVLQDLLYLEAEVDIYSVLRNQECKVQFCKNIGSDWRVLGGFLSIPDYILESIEQDCKENEDRAFKMLSHWIILNKNNSDNASTLRSALCRMNKLSLIEPITNNLIDTTETKVDIYTIFRNQEYKVQFCKYIGSDWKVLGGFLSIPDYILESIEQDCKENEDKAYEMLNHWIKLNEYDVNNADKLKRAFSQINKLWLLEPIVDDSLENTGVSFDILHKFIHELSHDWKAFYFIEHYIKKENLEKYFRKCHKSPKNFTKYWKLSENDEILQNMTEYEPAKLETIIKSKFQIKSPKNFTKYWKLLENDEIFQNMTEYEPAKLEIIIKSKFDYWINNFNCKLTYKILINALKLINRKYLVKLLREDLHLKYLAKLSH